MAGRKTGEIVNPTLQPKMPGLEPVAVVTAGQAQTVGELNIVKTTARGLVIPDGWKRLEGETDQQLWLRMKRLTEEQDKGLPYQAVK
ncbi:MAG: hypothetical protein WC596_00690 [Candidatus Shapirobacteria bacterium]